MGWPASQPVSEWVMGNLAALMSAKREKKSFQFIFILEGNSKSKWLHFHGRDSGGLEWGRVREDLNFSILY